MHIDINQFRVGLKDVVNFRKPQNGWGKKQINPLGSKSPKQKMTNGSIHSGNCCKKKAKQK